MATPPILTFTGNLLWEQTLEFDAWSEGRTQRARAASFQVGGKGVNVSKMLTRLGVETTALAFAGGTIGAECSRWLSARKIPHVLVSTEINTRVGFVVRAAQRSETTFLGPDAVPDATAWRRCAEYLAQRTDRPVLALCGSVPGWSAPEAEPVRTAFELWSKKCILTVDTYGPPLLWAVERAVALVKINRAEFDGLFPEPERVRAVSERLAEARKRWPVQAWVVTDGPEPVWFTDADHPPERLTPPLVQEISPTGSGDVLFAVLLDAHFRRHAPLAQALAEALPYAAANAASPGVAEFDLNNLPGPRSVSP